jgi:hypothetical protein
MARILQYDRVFDPPGGREARLTGQDTGRPARRQGKADDIRDGQALRARAGQTDL